MTDQERTQIVQLQKKGLGYKSFYSVGQHSINCMKEAKARGCSGRIQLAFLLHDASEAYLSDVTRPVKAELPKYKEIEAPLQNLIWQKYMGVLLMPDEERLVLQIDDDTQLRDRIKEEVTTWQRIDL